MTVFGGNSRNQEHDVHFFRLNTRGTNDSKRCDTKKNEKNLVIPIELLDELEQQTHANIYMQRSIIFMSILSQQMMNIIHNQLSNWLPLTLFMCM